MRGHTKSLPSRECGLKFTYTHMYYLLFLVTPLAGVWIEIQNPTACLWQENVSLPSRECGLKFYDDGTMYEEHQRHSPRGSVD